MIMVANLSSLLEKFSAMTHSYFQIEMAMMVMSWMMRKLMSLMVVSMDNMHSCTWHAIELVDLKLMLDRPMDNGLTERLAAVAVESFAMQEMKLAILSWERTDTLDDENDGDDSDENDCS